MKESLSHRALLAFGSILMLATSISAWACSCTTIKPSGETPDSGDCLYYLNPNHIFAGCKAQTYNQGGCTSTPSSRNCCVGDASYTSKEYFGNAGICVSDHSKCSVSFSSLAPGTYGYDGGACPGGGC
jgi:hypothetical protein